MSKENNEEIQEESLKNTQLDELAQEAAAEAEAVENELDLLQEELTSLKDKYARVHADFDNIKKRLEREKYAAVEYSNEKFAKDLIPVMDSLQMALSSTQNLSDPQEHLEKLKI
ncbi:MAG: nucleotide exchange factor GrpE, partial [Sulfurimonas sp.]|nr:nucleotide exchange factor GrpE [Sulfurimonas sp.]